MNRKFCFSKKEFAILLDGTGVTELFSVGLKPLPDMDEKEVQMILFQMYQKKFLVVDEQRYKMVPELSEIFSGIRDAEKNILIVPLKQNQTTKCIYVGKISVIVEYCGIQHGFYKISVGDWQECVKEALKEDFVDSLIECNSPILLEEESWCHQACTFCKHGSYDRLSAYMEKGLITVVEVRNSTGDRIHGTMLLVHEVLYDKIYYIREDAMCFYYKQQQVEELLGHLLEE